MKTPTEYLEFEMSRRNSSVRDIADKYPDFWKTADAGIWRARKLIYDVYVDLGKPDTNPLFYLWSLLLRYQISAILSILAKNLDEGVAVLRMASELCRVIKATSKNPGYFEKWFSGEARAHPQFKGISNFDANDAVEKCLRTCYELCSSYGVHGHKTSAIFRDDPRSDFEPSIYGVSQASRLWFLYFGTMHQMALKHVMPPPHEHYMEHSMTVMIIVGEFQQRLKIDPFFT